MLLGDGCLSYGKDPGVGRRGKPKPHDVFFGLNHSVNQTDYALWKANLIDKIFIDKKLQRKCTYSKTKKIDKKYNKVHHGLYVKFRWSTYLRRLRKWTYIQLAEKQHLKNIEYLLKNTTSPLHLAIWFMDDSGEKRKMRKSVRGTILGYDNPSYELYTYGYTEGQHNIIKDWFKRVYGVDPKIYISSKHRPEACRYLKFSVEDSRKIFEVCWPYFSQINSMKDKFWLSFAKYKPEILETPEKVDNIVQTTTSTEGLGN